MIYNITNWSQMQSPKCAHACTHLQSSSLSVYLSIPAPADPLIDNAACTLAVRMRKSQGEMDGGTHGSKPQLVERRQHATETFLPLEVMSLDGPVSQISSSGKATCRALRRNSSRQQSYAFHLGNG
jgi:hypothetical protein